MFVHNVKTRSLITKILMSHHCVFGGLVWLKWGKRIADPLVGFDLAVICVRALGSAYGNWYADEKRRGEPETSPGR